MKNVLFTFVTLLAIQVSAQESHLGIQGLHDVVAPTVFSDPATADKIQGMIYFDASGTGSFKGIGGTGTVVSLGAGSGNPVVSSGAGEKIERVTFGGASADITNCTADPCTRWRSTSGVSSVTWSSAGTYVINFVSGTFSSAPSCVGIGSNGVNAIVVMPNGIPTATTFPMQTVNSNTQVVADGRASVICMGTKP